MKTLENALRYFIIGGLFALPFIIFIVADGVRFPYNLFFPFITGKNLTFRLIVELITGAWLALALVRAEYRPRRSWLLLAFTVFLVVMAIADAQGANPFKSFWSNYERMDGWVTLAHLYALFLVATSVLSTEGLWKRFFHVSIITSVLASLYGFLQIAGVAALGQASGVGLSARVDGTFGNSIYLAVYLLFNIFIAAHLLFEEGEEYWSGFGKIIGACVMAIWTGIVLSLLGNDSAGTIIATILEQGIAVGLAAWFIFLRKKYLLYGVIVLDTFILFCTGTRGTMLGLAGGALLTLFILALAQKSKRIRTIAAGALALVVVLGGLIWLARGTALVHDVGFLDRLASISFTDSTIKSRFLNMHIALQGVKERPIFGWGQENYAIVFDKYYDPDMYGQEPWFDRVHDVVFDWLIAGGIVGFLAYMSLFAAALYGLWRATRASLGNRRIPVFEVSLFTGLMAAYFFHNLTVFDNITSYLMFIFILAYIAWRTSEAEETPHLLAGIELEDALLPFTGAIALIAACVVVWFVNVTPLHQNIALLYAIGVPGGPQTSLDYFKQALSYDSYGEQEVREQLAQVTAQLAAKSDVSNDLKQEYFNLAVTEMQKQEKVSPLDARFPLFEGIVYDSFGDYKDAITALGHAHDLSPKKQTILYQLGMTADAIGNTDQALQYFKEAYDAEPSVPDSQIMYAAELLHAKQDQAAAAIIQQLEETDSATDVRLAQALASRGEYDQIANIWEAHIAKSPSDIQAYFTLAAAYYGGGQPDKAIDALKRAEKASPSSAQQAEQYITQIQSGGVKKQ